MGKTGLAGLWHLDLTLVIYLPLNHTCSDRPAKIEELQAILLLCPNKSPRVQIETRINRAGRYLLTPPGDLFAFLPAPFVPSGLAGHESRRLFPRKPLVN